MKKYILISLLCFTFNICNAAWYVWGQFDDNNWSYKELTYNSQNDTYETISYISGFFMITSMNTWNFSEYSNLMLNPVFTSTTFVSSNYGDAQFRLGYNRYYPVYSIQYLNQSFVLLEPIPGYYKISFIANTNPKCIGLQKQIITENDAIDDINDDINNNEIIYNLNGIRFYNRQNLNSGIYIINNKLMIIK